MMPRFPMGLAMAILPISASAESNGKFSDSNGVQIHDYDQETGYRAVALDARGHKNPAQYGLEMSEHIARRLAHLDEIIEKNGEKAVLFESASPRP